MKKLTFDNLIQLAQQETAPGVDVADNVMATLSSLTGRTVDPYRMYLWTGIASAAAAACILIAAMVTWQTGNDSVSEMMTMVSWVAQ
ncbi:MAG: hypothetical protein ACYTET_01535 [Planctomycetota bacterium]|jgi:hypothetical protein